jgi:hypothetical protein
MTYRLSGMNRANYFFNSSRLPLRENQAYHESWYFTAQRIESARCIPVPAPNMQQIRPFGRP